MSRRSSSSQPIRIRARRGQLSAFEVAFTLVFAVFLTISGMEFARVSMLRHRADTSAYAAARSAIVPGATAEQAAAVARECLRDAGVQFATVSVQPTVITEATHQVRVHIDIPVAQNSWIAPKFMQSDSIRRSVTLLTERSPVLQSECLSAETDEAPSQSPAQRQSGNTTDPRPNTSPNA